MKLTQTITAARTVDAPRDLVWRVFCDVVDWAAWNPLVRDTRSPDGQPLHHGCDFAFGLTLRPLGLPVTIEAHVDEAVEAERVTWSGNLWGINARHTFLFSDRGTGCVVESHEVLSGLTLLGARLLYSPARLTQLTAAWLDALAKQAESQTKATGLII